MTITTSVRSHQNLRLSALKVTHLAGVGDRLYQRLQKCGIDTVQDLLFHLPYRYQDRTRITPLGSLKDADWAVIEGEVAEQVLLQGKKRTLQCRLTDGSGALLLGFFNFGPSMQQDFAVGHRVRCFGQVRITAYGKQMVHPEYHVLGENNSAPVDSTLTPIYHATAGLGQRSLRKLTDQALQLLSHKGILDDFFPKELHESWNVVELHRALEYVHRPPPDADVTLLESGCHPCQKRLAYEELLAHQFALLRTRQKKRSQLAPVMLETPARYNTFLKQLPFSLTGAQTRVCDEIFRDLHSDKPMLRLVQGDVGSGKTVVAALACLNAIDSGYQAALMAPTEILAEQHFQTLSNWLNPLGIQTAWLTGKLTVATRRDMLESIQSGKAQCAIGTHALFQDDVQFKNLGFVIIDEQHRFGVHQRLSLYNKGVQSGTTPHQLIMTATPIPRTLAMTAYADLDLSILDELPKGRSPVTTVVLSNQRRDEIITRLRANREAKHQCYWVCPFIEESETMQCQAAEETLIFLKTALPEFRIGLLHGRLKPVEKEQTMQQFKAGTLDLLVATTVIEVGVDVPNASYMVIENAERLGLSQCHQLRGRVGRGSAQSYCVLLYQAPLGFHSKERLRTLRETSDGFKLSEKDLQLRGAGEVLGTKQTGLASLRIADLLRDADQIPEIRRVARALFEENHECIGPLITRWLQHQEEYANV